MRAFNWPGLNARIRTVVLCLFSAAFIAACMASSAAIAADPLLARYLKKVTPSQLVSGADAFGPIGQETPVAPILKSGETVGWAFLTSDFVPTNGYSGKPIHIVGGIDKDAVITGVRLVKHYEPIVLIGIPDKRIIALTERYAGLDLKAEAASDTLAHELDIISGATVTIMVIDDSIVRAGLKVARALKLGGLAPKARDTGPRRIIDPSITAERSWMELTGDRSVSRLSLDVGQITEAFTRANRPVAAKRAESDDPAETFIDMYVGLASVPTIGLSLLGKAEYANLQKDLKEGEHALLIAGRGHYSFKGSGYVRGGIFDRIQLIQGDINVRFHDRDQRRIGVIAADGAPKMAEIDLFTIPADVGFEPTKPWRLQLLAARATGPVDKAFLTFDVNYTLLDRYTQLIEPAPSSQGSSSAGTVGDDDQSALWKRIWNDRKVDITILTVAIGILTVVFFFQLPITRNERFVYWFRISFLTFTLFWLGWYVNAQLSVVNVFAFTGALTGNFRWDTFLMDPLVFILWASVAVSMIFWGRGAYCGWLCPFGALQELTNRVAKLFKVPQITVPWGIHERLWPLKYMIFLGLFGLSLQSIEVAETYAEVEPFKTAIVLKFMRAWPYVLFAVGLLGIGLFIERFYCRYLCPLGAALAIPARLRTIDWLKRYRDCGSPCARCAKECMVQSIHPEGNINPNECLYCLHCQVLYQHDRKCPVCIKRLEKRKRFERQIGLIPGQEEKPAKLAEPVS